MRIDQLFILLLITLFFCSCLDLKSLETKQVYPSSNLSRFEKLEMHNYAIKESKSVTDSSRIKWYSDFFKDSTNYHRKKSIDNEKGEKTTYGITFISKEDTLDLAIYPAKSANKVVAAFFDPYDPNDPMKFRRYNRFYINNQILDSLKAHWK